MQPSGRRASAGDASSTSNWVISSGGTRKPSKSDPLADIPSMDYSDLTFVDESPQDERSNRRRRVQSHIARRQHRYRREAQSTSSSSSSASNITTPPTIDASPEVHIEDGVARIRLDSPKVTDPPIRPMVMLDLQPNVTLPLDDPGDKLSEYAKDLDISMPQVLECIRQLISIQSPDFEIKYAMPRGVVMEKYYPFVLSDPALLAAVTLVVISRLRFLQGQQHASLSLLRLRGFVIDGIQTALADPVRSTSDHIIMAVAVMSVYEALFGQKELHRIHMEGLRRMIELRGGLNRLDLDGLLDPLLLWYDAHTASILRSPLALKGLRSAAMYRQVDKAVFLLGVTPAHESAVEAMPPQVHVVGSANPSWGAA